VLRSAVRHRQPGGEAGGGFVAPFRTAIGGTTLTPMGEPAHRSDRELTDDQRSRLVAAHDALRDAVATYERCGGQILVPGRQIHALDAAALGEAQQAIRVAEDRLWQLREELLGWTRPPWAPSAALVTDWFSDEDTIYDDPPQAPNS
jgi:hypothetical protein